MAGTVTSWRVCGSSCNSALASRSPLKCRPTAARASSCGKVLASSKIPLLSHEIDLLKDTVNKTPAQETSFAASRLAQHLQLTDEMSALPKRGAAPKVTRDLEAKPRHPCPPSRLPIASASLLPRSPSSPVFSYAWSSPILPGPAYTPLPPGVPPDPPRPAPRSTLAHQSHSFGCLLRDFCSAQTSPVLLFTENLL